jgi:hypothetical protein
MVQARIDEHRHDQPNGNGKERARATARCLAQAVCVCVSFSSNKHNFLNKRYRGCMLRARNAQHLLL